MNSILTYIVKVGVVSPSQKRLFHQTKKLCLVSPNPNQIQTFFGAFGRDFLGFPEVYWCRCRQSKQPAWRRLSQFQNARTSSLGSWFFFGFSFWKKAPNIGSLLSKNEHWFNCSWSWVCIPNVFFVLSEIGVSFASKWEANINFDSKKGKFGIQLSCWCDDWSPCWETFGSPKTGLPWKLGKTQMIFLPWKSATFDQITLYS